MKREDVIRLAEQAGFEIEQPSDGHNVSGDNACLERFAALVAAAEREACAEVLVVKIKRHEQFAEEAALRGEYGEVTVLRSTARKLSECVAEIRARGNT
jgi:hypothetical protein